MAEENNRTDKSTLESARDTLTTYVNENEINAQCGDAILTFINTFDEENVITQNTTDQSNKSESTLLTWIYHLMILARHRDLTTATQTDVSIDLQALYDGTHPHVKDSGLSKSTLRTYQVVLRAFYAFHDFDVKHDDIGLISVQSTQVDENDMLTRDEIHALRDAADNPRDKMLVDLLLYTGQRQGALRRLRLKDINIGDATYQYNVDEGGLKGAEDRQGNRPLLLAESSVRTWINDYHPDTSDQDHYLITGRPNYCTPDPSTPVTSELPRRIMSKLKDETGITKPCHPHALRHNFVTLAVKQYGMTTEEIKFAIGHKKNSNVMETTYSHLSASEYTNRMKEKAGLKEPEDKSSLTPNHCPSCHEPLSPTDRACNKCGTMFTPDAVSAKEQLQADMTESAMETETDVDREHVKNVQALLNDPELVAEFLSSHSS